MPEDKDLLGLYGPPSDYPQGVLINPKDVDKINQSDWGALIPILSQPEGSVRLCRYTFDGSNEIDVKHDENDKTKFIIDIPVLVLGFGAVATIGSTGNLVFTFKRNLDENSEDE